MVVVVPADALEHGLVGGNQGGCFEFACSDIEAVYIVMGSLCVSAEDKILRHAYRRYVDGRFW